MESQNTRLSWWSFARGKRHKFDRSDVDNADFICLSPARQQVHLFCRGLRNFWRLTLFLVIFNGAIRSDRRRKQDYAGSGDNRRAWERRERETARSDYEFLQVRRFLWLVLLFFGRIGRPTISENLQEIERRQKKLVSLDNRSLLRFLLFRYRCWESEPLKCEPRSRVSLHNLKG